MYTHSYDIIRSCNSMSIDILNGIINARVKMHTKGSTSSLNPYLMMTNKLSLLDVKRP